LLGFQDRRNDDRPGPEPGLLHAEPDLADGDRVGQLVVGLAVHRADRRRLLPHDQIIVFAQAPPLAEVGPAVRRQAADRVDAPLLEQVHADPALPQAVAQQHVAGAEHVPQLAQEADLLLALAGVAADAQVEDRRRTAR
jgi:hypothetical protein